MEAFTNITADDKNNLVNLFMEEVGIKTKENLLDVYYFDNEFFGITEKEVTGHALFADYVKGYWADKIHGFLKVKEEQLIRHALIEAGKGFVTHSHIMLILGGQVKDDAGITKVVTDTLPQIQALQNNATLMLGKSLKGEAIWDGIIELNKTRLVKQTKK